MAVSEDLTVPYHQQDTDYYCGAACDQMVLDSIGAGLLDQDDLYNDNHNHNLLDSAVDWSSPPDGIAWTLNQRRPATFTNSFVLFALANEDAISRKICWTIHHYQVAPIALVYGWQHWIAVRGYEASAAPQTYNDTTYSIQGFRVNNPWPPVPSFYAPPVPPPPAPPPHGGTDGCGTGGDRGVADEHISYATWQSSYMTGVPAGHWQGQFLAVCDPEPPPDRRGTWAPVHRPARGDTLLQPRQAAEYALEGLRRTGLGEQEAWQKGLRKAKPAEPVLVQRLDRTDSYYYLVPFETSRRKVSVIASVDGRFGNYRQAVLLPEVSSNWYAAFDTKAVTERVAGRRIDLGQDRGRLVVRKESFCLHPHLVWQPCRESLSPYWPFYMVTVGSARIYVRIDGVIFPSLTTDVKGI